jgi:hypothetical protein
MTLLTRRFLTQIKESSGVIAFNHQRKAAMFPPLWSSRSCLSSTAET